MVRWEASKSIVLGTMVLSSNHFGFRAAVRLPLHSAAGATVRVPVNAAASAGVHPSSCRIRMVAFASAAVPAWSLAMADSPQPAGELAGVMALPAEVAEALEDGQLDLFR